MRKLLLMMAALMMMLVFAVPVFAEEREGYPYEVGDKVWAKIEDTEEGTTLFFYSEEGTLSGDWQESLDLVEVEVIRFASESGRMYLPEDSSWIFSDLSSVQKIELDKANTSNVTIMKYMFENCCKLKSLDLTNFDTSKVTEMTGVFYGCSGLTSLDVSNFDTSNVTEMPSMFVSGK